MPLFRPSSGRWLLLLALVLAAALRVPGWFTEEVMDRYRLFETDEEQHLAVAFNRYNELVPAADSVAHRFPSPGINVRGLGQMMATTAWVVNRTFGTEVSFGSLLFIGRGLSTVFALLLVVVVYRIGRVSGLPPAAAGVAALLVAAADLNATYSHYAVPAIGYVFWSYLALLGGISLIKKPSFAALTMLAVGAAGAVAFKFDVIPLAAGGGLLLWLAVRREGRLPWWYVAVGSGILLGAFLLLTAGWSWEEIVHSFRVLRRENADVIAVDDHFRDNLITYPAAVLAGIGLPAFGLAVFGLLKVLGRLRGRGRGCEGGYLAVVYAAVFLLTEAFLRYYMDTTFVRRANIFIPAVALLAAYALHLLRAKPGATALVIAWSVGLAVVGQNNHWNDPRYAFRDWANANVQPPLRLGITGYLNVRGLEHWKYYKYDPFDYFAAHETMIRKYRKSLTTPFGEPTCCTEIYHCGDVAQCHDFKAILHGRRDDLVLVQAFRARDYFPERLLYRYFFGYYETFLGDVEVYKRIRPQSGERTTS